METVAIAFGILVCIWVLVIWGSGYFGSEA
jgi:hypothetical protein